MVIDFGKLWAKLDKIGKWWLLISLLVGAAWSIFTKCNGYVQLPGRVDGIAEDVDSLKGCAQESAKRDTIRAMTVEALSERMEGIEQVTNQTNDVIMQMAIQQGVPVVVVRDTVKVSDDD